MKRSGTMERRPVREDSEVVAGDRSVTGVLIRSRRAGQLPWSGPFVDPEGEADGSTEGGRSTVAGSLARKGATGRSTVAGSLARKGATGREEEGLLWSAGWRRKIRRWGGWPAASLFLVREQNQSLVFLGFFSSSFFLCFWFPPQNYKMNPPSFL